MCYEEKRRRDSWVVVCLNRWSEQMIQVKHMVSVQSMVSIVLTLITIIIAIILFVIILLLLAY